jgi:hypothetical protein
MSRRRQSSEDGEGFAALSDVSDRAVEALKRLQTLGRSVSLKAAK